MTLESLNCPNCGAPLPDPAGRPTVSCTHCHTVVRVATAAAGGPPVASTEDAAPYTPATRLPPELSAKLIELLRAGRKIEAIQHYQNQSAVGLKEAKDVVEAIEAGLQPLVRPAIVDRLPSGDAAQIRSLLERGNKIAAIKLYRERTGTGLKAAKDAVEAIERGGEPPVVAMARAMHNVPAGVDLAHIQDVLKSGNKVEAIRLYRNYSGQSLKASKDAVEAIAASTPGVPAHLGKTDTRGCWNVLLVIAVFVMCIFGGCGTVAQTTATYRCVMREVKNDLAASELLGGGVNAGYLVLSPGYSQSWDLDGSWRLSMDLFMPAWGSRGLGWLYVSANADDSGYTVARSTLFADWGRHVVGTWEQVTCR